MYSFIHPANTISTDAWNVSKQEVLLKRGLVYLGLTGIVLLMFDNWHTGDEIFGATTRPYSAPVPFLSFRLTSEMFPRK